MDFEKMYRQLDEFMKNKGNMSEEEALKKFMELYNSHDLDIEDTNEVMSIEKLDEAMEAKDEKDAKRLAKEALNLDPNNADAKLFLLGFEDDLKKLDGLDKIIKETEDYLTKEGFFDEDNIGEFYVLYETRPYMRILYTKAITLLENGMVKRAQEVLERILELNENDNLGARYLLSGVYAYFEDKDYLNKLIKKYEGDFGLSFDLAKLVLVYKEGDEKKALEYLKVLNKKNPNFIGIMIDKIGHDEIINKVNLSYYSPGDLSEAVNMIADFSFVLLPMTMFYVWIRKNAKKLK